MTPRDARRDLVRLLRENSRRHHLWDVFGDFVALGAIAVSNAVDLRSRDVREARYHEILRRYDRAEIDRFPVMLAALAAALESEPADHLGQVFAELELQSRERGQFFTPYELCRVTAALTLGNAETLRTAIAAKGYLTLLEPAVGAGALVIAAAEHLRAEGLDPARVLHVTAVDVDARAVHMAYLQLALLGIPAVVILGNSLTLEEREHWYTPAHILGGWFLRLRGAETPVSRAERLVAVLRSAAA